MKYLLFGFHSIQAGLKQQPELFQALHIVKKETSNKELDNIIQLAQSHQIPIVR